MTRREGQPLTRPSATLSPLRGARGRERRTLFDALLPARGEKVPEGRMRGCVAVALLMLVASAAGAQAPRIASDFEIAQMKAQIARSRDFVAQLSGRLNLGDLYLTRNEPVTARSEYAKALELATAERLEARRASDMTRYSTATAYAGLAEAKLGRGGNGFALLEESIRYTADSAKSWNLYASAMSLIGRSAKAASAARNAVAIATHDVERNPSVANRLDLGIYQYALASSAADAEAERLLRTVLDNLRSPAFDAVRREVARSESFEVYSTARGDESAYLSLLNRAQLRLASLLEKRGDVTAARAAYERVLETRTDDPTALAALARLAPVGDRERFFAAAFDANPFSLPLIREYQRHVAESVPQEVDDSTTGGKVRRALAAMRRGEMRSARATLDELIAQFPGNETLRVLRREAEPRLVTESLTPQELDTKVFTATVVFDPVDAPSPAGVTVFHTGEVDGVPFRFSEPTAFKGTFAAGAPLRLTYRVLGATEIEGRDALLLEPLQLEALR
jgi:tetratricopeptide (TPR) repeat protein